MKLRTRYKFSLWDQFLSLVAMIISIVQLWEGDTEVAIYWVLVSIVCQMPSSSQMERKSDE